MLCSQEGDEHPWRGRGLGGTQPPGGSQVERGSCSRGIKGPDGANDPNPKGSEGAKIGVGELGHGQHGLSVR